MKTTKEQIDYMIHAYVVDKKNTYQIADELGLSNPTVGNHLRKNGIVLSPQKYKFNEHYFKEIDTPNKAYFLGLIYADGCVFPKKNSCSIKLTKEDDYILEEFKKDIGSQKPLSYTKSKPIAGTSYVGKAQSKIELNSKILIDDLRKLGVVQNKSLILNFPSDILYMKDFIRGYFDGDGCIYNSQKRIMLNFVGSEHFCKGLCSFLKSELDIDVSTKQDKRGNSWYIYIHRIGDVLKFCKYIYEDENCIKLNRKYEKYKTYLGRSCKESWIGNNRVLFKAKAVDMTLTRYKENLRVVDNKVYSYNTHVATIHHDEHTVQIHGWWSVTTSKHINYVASVLNYKTIK